MTQEFSDIDPEVEQIGDKKIEYYCTKGDGDCFFHAAFGEKEVYETPDRESYRAYLIHNAKKMREELAKFFRNNIDFFEEYLALACHSIRDYVTNHEKTLSNIKNYNDLRGDYSASSKEAKAKYREACLMLLKDQDYNIHETEIKYIASISNTRIILYVGNITEPQIVEPDPKIVKRVGEINTELWGNRGEVTIFHKGVVGLHFYKAEVISDDTKQPKLQDEETNGNRKNEEVQVQPITLVQLGYLQKNGDAPRSTKGISSLL